MCGIESALDGIRCLIGAFQTLNQLLPQLTSLVIQKRLGSLPIHRSEMRHVAAEPLTGKDVVQNHKSSKILLRLAAQEGSHPQNCAAGWFLLGLVGLDFGNVVPRTMTFIEGIVDNDFPV